jgi:hypothetical protein
VGFYLLCVVATDVNGDGKMDLIIGSSSAGVYNGHNGLTVLINTTPFPPPFLNIMFAGDQVALSWPGWETHYVLESCTDLTAPDWTTVTNGTPVPGGVTLTNTAPAAFFRLHQF